MRELRRGDLGAVVVVGGVVRVVRVVFDLEGSWCCDCPCSKEFWICVADTVSSSSTVFITTPIPGMVCTCTRLSDRRFRFVLVEGDEDKDDDVERVREGGGEVATTLSVVVPGLFSVTIFFFAG